MSPTRTLASVCIGLACLLGAERGLAQGTSAPDPERLALAEQLFSAMHLDTAMRGVFANMFKSMANSVANGQPNPRAQQFMASYAGGLDGVMPELVHDMAQAYARVLTTQELADSLKFYNSPSGQAILAKTPEIMQQIMSKSLTLMPKIAAAAEADFCGKETCTDAERAVFKRMKSMGANAPAPAAGGY